MMATQKALALMTGIATNVPMIAKTAKTTEMMNTAVVGGDRFISNLLFVDLRTVIAFSRKSRGFTLQALEANLRLTIAERAAKEEAG
jgi:hypothetical protein